MPPLSLTSRADRCTVAAFSCSPRPYAANVTQVPSHRARQHNRVPRRTYFLLAVTVLILAAAVTGVRLATDGTRPARTAAATGPVGSTCATGAGCASAPGQP